MQHGTGGANGPNIVPQLDRLSDAQIIRVILEGEGRMPAQDVTEEEAQAIVDHMRANF